jgi:type IV secretory pathway VirB4 component
MQPEINNLPTITNSPQFAPASIPKKSDLSPTKKRGNPNSSQNTLEIAEIRDGIVILKDGSFRSVVMVKPINFDLMSPEERDAVEYSYQGFLNSLYFPIQIFIHSERVDIQPYLDMIHQYRTNQQNMLLGLLMDDYLEYMQVITEQSNIMDKKFYVVVPFSPTEEAKPDIATSKSFFYGLVDIFSSKERGVTINEADLLRAKDELRNRVQSILSGLRQSSIQGIALDTQELIELYYNTYNPDTSVRQQLKDFDGLSTPVVEKGGDQTTSQNSPGGFL